MTERLHTHRAARRIAARVARFARLRRARPAPRPAPNKFINYFLFDHNGFNVIISSELKQLEESLWILLMTHPFGIRKSETECPMLTQTIQLFTEKEEEFVNLLIEIGMRRTVAKVLVFLANVDEATSRDIERGTDLRQPEVSIAMNYMFERDWLKNRESKAMSKGRPVKIYTLAVPVPEIMSSIEKQKKTEAKNQLALVKKMRDYI
jgi:predicted transcriptional regulator